MKQSPKVVLANSLEELLKKRSFDNITVGEIADNCGVSRTTFYRHFKDKYDCMNWGYQNRIAQIEKENSNIASWKNLIRQLAEFLYEKKEYFSKVNQYTEQNSLMECIYHCGMEYATKMVEREKLDGQLSREDYYLLHMYMTATVECINIWLREGCPGGPEFLAEMQSSFMPEPLRQYFI